MHINTFSYRYAEEILQHPRYKQAYDELIYVCENCPVARYDGKSAKQPRLNVVQQIMNTYFLVAFTALGWEEEPLATPDEYDDALRSDFRKTFFCDSEPVTIQIEVEFGNVASSYRNYFKFQLSFSNNLCDIAVLIVPSQHLCCRIDSGVSNFEKAVRELPSAKLSTTVPVLVVGLFDEDDDGNPIEEWDVKSVNPDLKVLKGDNKTVYPAHRAIVERYVYDYIKMSD